MRNLQEQVKKAFSHQKLFWPFTVWMNCSSDLKNISRLSEQFFLTVCQNNFGNKIPIGERFAMLFFFVSKRAARRRTLLCVANFLFLQSVSMLHELWTCMWTCVCPNSNVSKLLGLLKKRGFSMEVILKRLGNSVINPGWDRTILF